MDTTAQAVARLAVELDMPREPTTADILNALTRAYEAGLAAARGEQLPVGGIA